MAGNDFDAKDAEVAETIARTHKRELAACDQILGETLGHISPWKGRDISVAGPSRRSPDEIILMELVRTLASYGASVQLTRTGYAEQASMLNRSLFEGMLVAHWVHANGAEAEEQFRRAGRLNDYLWVERLENTGWFEEDDVPIEAIEVEQQELAALKLDFGKYGERLWTGHRSIRYLVADVEDMWDDPMAKQELHNYLRVAHHDNNQILHSTVSGLNRLKGPDEEDGIRLALGPSLRHVPQSLLGAYWNFAQLVTLIFDRFQLPDRSSFDLAMERREFDFYRFTAAEVEGVGRNDPCPCGSGEKFKRCHEEQVAEFRK
ncbi:MAG: SEC-C domain-containing protein [Actinobacteria bacterium]|nr:SEC-C domain-containing protein [Actinomycetota bacterium]